MFGLFNLPKLLLLAAIIFGVWYGFKWLNARQAQVGKSKKQRSFRQKSDAESQPIDPDIEEMIPCPDCGAYVAKGSKHRCG